MALSARSDRSLSRGGRTHRCSRSFTNQRWFDHHILPSFYLMRAGTCSSSRRPRLDVRSPAPAARVARPRIGRVPDRIPAASFAPSVAAVLAIVAGAPRAQLDASVERVAALRHRAAASAGSATRLDVRARSRESAQDGRRTDDHVHVRRPGYSRAKRRRASRPGRPTILFVGESVMFGEGLNWEETIPAQVGALMDVQTREPRRARLRDRSVVPAPRSRAAALSPAGRGRLAVHDRAPRPESGRQPSAPRARIGLDAADRSRPARVTRRAHRAVSPRRRRSSAALR